MKEGNKKGRVNDGRKNVRKEDKGMRERRGRNSKNKEEM